MSLSLASWGERADRLAQSIDRLHGPVTLVRRCADLVELLAVVRSGLARAVLVDAHGEDLTGSAVDLLREAGAAVVVLREAADAEDLWRSCGALPLAPEIGPRDAADRILQAHEDSPPVPAHPPEPAAPSPDSRWRGRLDPDAEDPADDGEPGSASDAGPASAEAGSARRGRVLVVWGPHGSPGRTTAAINIAAELAAAGVPTTLVDLDTWGPAVASGLGLLDEAAGVALAARAADRRRLDDRSLEQALVSVPLPQGRLDVLTGLTRPDRWPELRAGSVRRVLEACRSRVPERAQGPGPVVVVDIGFCLEAEEELAFDTAAPRRNAAALVALEEADLVLALVAADVVGIPRAARAVPELLETAAAPVVLAASKVRRTASGHSPGSAVAESWAAIGGPGRFEAFLSWDPRTLDHAALEGAALLECAPRSALRRELASLALRLLERLDGREQPVAEPEPISGSPLRRRLSGLLTR